MTPDPKAIWQTVLATAYQEYTAAKNSDRSHRAPWRKNYQHSYLANHSI